MPEEEEVWIFGYGSLVHTPGFKHKRRVEGYISGWRRVFWQGSTDHRGTPSAPGRTVTLVADPTAKTWGVAFQLDGDADEAAATIKYLNWRERQYDVRVRADVHSACSGSGGGGGSSGGSVLVRGALVYVATDSPANANWLGPAPLDAIARQVARAVGPSGPNYDYVYRLAGAMRRMRVDDADLFALEAAVRAHRAAAEADGCGGGDGGGGNTVALAAAAGAGEEALSEEEAELRRRHAMYYQQQQQQQHQHQHEPQHDPSAAADTLSPSKLAALAAIDVAAVACAGGANAPPPPSSR